MRRVATAVPAASTETVRAQLAQQYPLQQFSAKQETCPVCGAAFVIIFHNRYDEGNEGYATSLKKTIAENCDNGQHRFDGYPLVTP
jgi:ribosomal protein S27AE